jgi:hypothetical protein
MRELSRRVHTLVFQPFQLLRVLITNFDRMHRLSVDSDRSGDYRRPAVDSPPVAIARASVPVTVTIRIASLLARKVRTDSTAVSPKRNKDRLDASAAQKSCPLPRNFSKGVREGNLNTWRRKRLIHVRHCLLLQ